MSLNNRSRANENRNAQKTIEMGIEDFRDSIKTNETESPDEERLYEKGFIDPKAFLKTHGYQSVKAIYQDYHRSITRKDRAALSEDRFTSHFFEDGSFDHTFMYGDEDQGYVLGSILTGNVYQISHFAPKSLRKGYELLQILGESPKKVILFVTPDLAQMFFKLGGNWEVIDSISLPAYFHTETTQKIVIHNGIPDVYKTLATLIQSHFPEYQFHEQIQSLLCGIINREAA